LILSIPIFSAFVLDNTVYGKTAAIQYMVIQDKCVGLELKANQLSET
jgi:hypothetical protein